MKITNYGRGIHQRERVGIDKLQKGLPPHWYAYTNLDLALTPGEGREIDLIIVAEDRIFLVDIKDWKGPIQSREGSWFNNNRYVCSSPVRKLAQNVRDLLPQLKRYLQQHAKQGSVVVPMLQYVVVLTSAKDTSGIAATEVEKVMSVETFIKSVKDQKRRNVVFGSVHSSFYSNPLTDNAWKDRLAKFFNTSKGVFTPGQRDYGGFFAREAAVFVHPKGVYSEYEASDDRPAPSLGTLRLWDLTKAAAHFQTAEGRAEIAGREQGIISYLQDASDRCDEILLGSRARDPDLGVSYWEVFDRRRRLQRLADFAVRDLVDLGRQERLELARQVLAAVDALHLAEAAHLDLGLHSVWVQRPSTVRLSHLMASSYPRVETLGESRYDFLASTVVPEDVYGEVGTHKQRDVFLLGALVHRLLFGVSPPAPPGEPPEWDPAVDVAAEYGELHGWFSCALHVDPTKRFGSAGDALSSFNHFTAERPTPREVIESLERYKGKIQSQYQLFAQLPPIEMLRDDDRRAIWRSRIDGSDVLVKVWKRASWGEQTREGSRILDFLDRLASHQQAKPPGCANIIDAFWLGDAIVMVQEWIDRPDLEKLSTNCQLPWQPVQRVEFCLSLARLVKQLHDQRIAHGDLKPSNVLVDTADPGNVVLIDTVDFSCTDDGDLKSSSYAPESGGRFERDTYAVTKITEELLSSALEEHQAAHVQASIKQIRAEQPANSTLLPLIEALEAPSAKIEPTAAYKIYSNTMAVGPLLADEGRYYLRPHPQRAAILIRGACEELAVDLNQNGKPYRARRFALDQRRISAFSRYEFGAFEGEIEILDGPVLDLSELNAVLERADVAEHVGASPNSLSEPPVSDEEQPEDELELSETAEDALTEKIASGPNASGDVDAASLWAALVAAEKELITFGEASDDSFFNRDSKRHVAGFDLLGGSFDYDRRDRVLVERQDDRGNWRAIAHLDIQRSRPDALHLDDGRFDIRRQGPLVYEGDRLRFRSHFEQTSFDRRQAAVTRIIGRNSRTRDLIDFFDTRKSPALKSVDGRLSAETLKERYKLNDVQSLSLSAVLQNRPISLVQGPPGTGKTVFIAALVHAALTSGLANNVLLASQAHEAVNNAAEAVLRLFEKGGQVPSIIRVGNENVVSDRLLPFHAARVEQLYKDRFQAEMRERLQITSRALGLDDNLADQLMHVELAIRPVVDTLSKLVGSEEKAREESLRTTLQQQLVPLGIPATLVARSEPDTLVQTIVAECTSNIPYERRPSPDQVARFQSAAALARDFVASVSTEQRSFETFLAGTRHIVAGTCVGLGRSSLGLTATPFDLVIVDEAARCTASELAVPIQAANWVVLVGDHKQLEPQHPASIVEQVAEQSRVPEAEVSRSDFERMFKSSIGDRAGHTLTTQYRMLSAIGDIVSSSFYPDSPLEHGRKTFEIPPEVLPPDLTHAVTWVDTAVLGETARQSEPDRRKSLSNPVEAECIVALLKRWSESDQFVDWLSHQQKHAHAIGVICAYAAQRDLIRRKLQSAGISPILKGSVKIDTIDSYQGKENPIVIVSLVRNNWEGKTQNGIKTIKPGFLATPNRINVAISRAMDRLVIVGSRTRWTADSPMWKIGDAFAQGLRASRTRHIGADEVKGSPTESKGPSAGKRHPVMEPEGD